VENVIFVENKDDKPDLRSELEKPIEKKENTPSEYSSESEGEEEVLVVPKKQKKDKLTGQETTPQFPQGTED